MKKARTLFFVIVLLSITKVVVSQTYFVSNSGDDINDGMSVDQTWRTLEKVNLSPLQEGDSVLFKCGDFWRGQLIPQSGTSGSVVYYGSYGEGEKPVLCGSVNLSGEADWQDQGGDLWSSTRVELGNEQLANTSFDADFVGWTLYTEGSANASGVIDASDYMSAPGALKINCVSGGENMSDIQLSTSPITITAGSTYRLSFFAKSSDVFVPGAIFLMKAAPPFNLYFSNYIAMPHFETGWTEYVIYYTALADAFDAMVDFMLGGVLEDNTSIFIDDISFKEVTSDSPISCDVGNIIFDNETAFGTKKLYANELLEQGDYYFDSVNLCVNIYSEENPATYYDDIECALTKHIIEQTEKSYITYENLALTYGGAHGIGGGNTSNITVKACDISYIGGGAMYFLGFGTVRYGNGIEFWGNADNNIVEACRISQIYDAGLTNQNAGSPCSQTNIIYRNNYIENAEWSFEYWNKPETSVTSNIYFVNNTCRNAGITWAHEQRPDKRGRHLNFFENQAATDNFKIYNNIFIDATSACMYFLLHTNISSFDIDYNCWHQTLNDTLIDMRYGYALIESYTSAEHGQFVTDYSQDANSIVEDPDLSEIGDGWIELNSSSPCIDSGSPETSGLMIGDYDYFGNARVQNGDGELTAIIDIGCFEHSEVSYYLETGNNDVFEIFPNPACEFVSFEIHNSEISSIEIFDMQGRLVLKSIFQKQGRIDVSKLNAGAYLIKANVGRQAYYKKLLIE